MRSIHRHTRVRIMLFVIVVGSMTLGITTASSQGWPQWGGNQKHTGFVNIAAQNPNNILANVVSDPFAAQETGGGGGLAVHYQAALVDGSSVYMAAKSGEYTGSTSWETQIWNERKLTWFGNSLVQ